MQALLAMLIQENANQRLIPVTASLVMTEVIARKIPATLGLASSRMFVQLEKSALKANASIHARIQPVMTAIFVQQIHAMEAIVLSRP
jgi:hypothetical protein